MSNKTEKLDELRIALDDALSKLEYVLPEGEERDVIDHCIDCVDQLRVSQSKADK